MERTGDAAHSHLTARWEVGGLSAGDFRQPYRALREALSVPEDDQFMTITEHDSANFRYGASYLGVARSDDLVFIRITVFNTRTLEQKKHCSGGWWNCSAKALASARRTCS
jgi:hypothetical protein